MNSPLQDVSFAVKKAIFLGTAPTILVDFTLLVSLLFAEYFLSGLSLLLHKVSVTEVHFNIC